MFPAGEKDTVAAGGIEDAGPGGAGLEREPLEGEGDRQVGDRRRSEDLPERLPPRGLGHHAPFYARDCHVASLQS